MLAFRSLDPFRALREPDRRRRDEERLSRSEQRTLSKTQNNHLTGKAPYKFESISLQRRVYCELDFRGQLVCEAIDLPKVLKTITFSPARVRPETVRCAKIGLE